MNPNTNSVLAHGVFGIPQYYGVADKATGLRCSVFAIVLQPTHSIIAPI